jgi:hypothetical protein
MQMRRLNDQLSASTQVDVVQCRWGHDSFCVVQCVLINAVHPFQNWSVAIIMGSSDDQKKFGIVWQNQILHVLEKVPSENMRGI